MRESLAHDGKTVFSDSTYPKIFGDEVMDAYMSSWEAFTSIFQDNEKYNVIMQAIGQLLIQQTRHGWDNGENDAEQEATILIRKEAGGVSTLED